MVECANCRVLSLDVPLELTLVAASHVTEDTVRMFGTDMLRKLVPSPKADLLGIIAVNRSSRRALVTPKPQSTMNTILVLPQSSSCVKSCLASNISVIVDMGAGKGRNLKMVCTDMSLKSLMFPKCLVARWICCTSVSIMAFMCFSMSS
jgi:hypothetical protein